MPDQTPPRRKFHPVYLLLALPWIAHLLVPIYNRIDPRFLGIPFFYWWQALWILLAALCILPVYLYERFQEKCEAVFRPEPRPNKDIERRGK